MKLAFRIALRFLFSSKGQTILITLGIAIGISVQIFIGSLISGLQVSLLDAAIGRTSQITVRARTKNDPLDNYREINDILINDFKEITHVSPTITKGGFILFDENFDQMLFRGFDLQKAEGIYKFEESLLDGGKMPGENEIIIGRVLAEDNDIKTGDEVKVITAESDVFDVTVSGIFDLKVSAVNESWVIGNLEMAKTIFKFPSDQVTAIEMQINEPFDADSIGEEMKIRLTSYDVEADDWKAANEQLLSGLNGQSTSSLMIQIFVVISVVLGIASVLAITVLQKSRQIGILKAMGVNDSTASMVFLFQGIILESSVPCRNPIWSGTIDILYYFCIKSRRNTVVPIYIEPAFIVLSGFIAVTASTAASVIPAIKSKKLSPIEVIRNG